MTADPLANDLDLVEQAREGSQDAIVELWVRHYPAALSAARRTSRQPRDAEELASDAFSNMLAAFASGGGPTGSVRAYLLTSVRNLAVTRSRRSSSTEVLSDDVALFEDGTRTTADPMSRQTEISMMRQAFAALPRRWQIILWRTAVDHDRNIEIGHDLGITPNAVAALAKRARRGLRQAYLQTHLSLNGLDAGCEPFVRRLTVLAVDGSTPSDDLAAHLGNCRTCPGRLAELRRVEQQLGSMLLPAILLTSPAFLTPTLAGAVGTAAGGAAGATAGEAVAVAVGQSGASAGAGGAGAGAGASAGAGGVGGVGAAAGAGAGGAGSPAGASTLIAKLTLGKIAAMAGGAVAALSAALLIPGEEPPSPPPSAQVAPASRPPTSSLTPTRTRTATPTRSQPTTRAPSAPPAPPVSPARRTPSPTRPTPSSPTPTTTPSTTAATPLRVGMRITGSRDATSIDVNSQARSTTGGLRLTLTVPAGVTLRSASGDWRSCTQSGGVISCTARSARGRWSGTILTSWSATASGRVTVEVRTTYPDGGRGSASASATWPP